MGNGGVQVFFFLKKKKKHHGFCGSEERKRLEGDMVVVFKMSTNTLGISTLSNGLARFSSITHRVSTCTH